MNEKTLTNKTVSGISWKFAERIAAQAVTFVVSVIIARILSPDDYSVISIAAIFFAFANVFIYSGLNTALIQKKDADITDYSSVLFVSLIVSIVLYAILFFCAPLIASIYKKEILVSVIRVMGLTLIIGAVNSILGAYISNRLEFRKFFFATIIGTVISAFVGIYMAVSGFGVWALVAQQMTNCTIDTIILWIVTRFRPTIGISKERLKPMLSYGWKIFVSSMITTAYDEAFPLIIGLKFTPADLAFYSKGKSVPSTASSAIGDTISAVIFPIMSKLQDDREKLLEYTRKFIMVSSFAVLPMLVGLFAVSDNLVSVLLTDKWLPASFYLRIFCLSFITISINNAHLQAIRALGRSDLILKMEIVKKVSYLLFVVSALALSSRPQVLAYVVLAAAVVATIINTYPCVKLINYSYLKQLSDLKANAITAFIMGSVVFAMNYLPGNKLLVLVGQIAVGVVIYVSLNLVLKNSALIFCRELIKDYFGHKDKRYEDNQTIN